MRAPLLTRATDSGMQEAGCIYYRWLVVGLTFLVVLVLFVQRINLSVSIIPWSRDCPSWTEKDQQKLLGGFFRGYLVTMFPGAVLCTRLTAYNVGLAAVLVLSSTASALMPLAGCDASRALWLRAAMGAAQGPLFPLVSGMFGQWVRSSEYSRANAFVCEGSNLGVLVAYPVTALLCRFRGWQSSFVLPALAAIPCLLMLLVLGSSTPETNRWISASELQLLQADKSSRSSKDGTLVSARSKGFRVKWLALLTNPNVLVLMLNWFTLNWCMWVLLTELPKYLSGALGFDLTASGFISDLPPIANTIGSLVFALLADHLIATGSCSTLATRRIMNGVGAVGTAACLGLVPLMSSTPLIIGLLCASQGFCAATNSGIFSNVFDIAPRSCAVLVGVTNSVPPPWHHEVS